MQRTWKLVTLLSVITLALISFSFPAMASCASNNHIRPADIVSDEVNKLFQEQNYTKLDELAQDYEKGNKPTFDRQSALMAFYQGISQGFNGCAKSKKLEEDWKTHEQAIMDWIKASPNSIPAKLALALFTINYGWRGRGSGYASTVDEKSWAVFKERIASAKTQLDNLAKSCSRNPAWYAGMLDIALAQGWTPKAFNSVYQKAIHIDPYYLSIHYTSANFYSPIWYGSKKQLQDSIDKSVKYTSARLGKAMYARLYWTVSDDPDMFQEGGVDWKRMKAGFEDSLHIYPDDWTRSNFARFACTAKDSRTLNEQLAKLGDHVRQEAWPNKDFYEYCKALAKTDGTGRQPQCFRREDTGAIFCE